MRPVIVSLGSLPIDKGLRSVAQEFGWSLVRVPARRQIQKTCKAFDVVAILFEPKAIAASWQEALKIVQAEAPGALPIVCHRFSESLPWPELAHAGAFHELWLPFDLGEVRQSWGFVQSASLRRGVVAVTLQRRDSFVA